LIWDFRGCGSEKGLQIGESEGESKHLSDCSLAGNQKGYFR
jgi:hypothetical protein